MHSPDQNTAVIIFASTAVLPGLCAAVCAALAVCAIPRWMIRYSTGLIAHKWGLFLSTHAHSLGHIGGNVVSPSPINGVGG